MAVRVAKAGQGPVAARRSLAGLEAGGEATRRAERAAKALTGREAGQSLPLVLGCAVAVIFTALLLAAIGGAITGKGRVQRAADLAALSAARSMRDDFDRLLAPARLPNGAPNPAHLGKGAYLARAAAAGREAADRNGVDPRRIAIEFPDEASFAPVRARAKVSAELDPDAVPGAGRSRRAEVARGGRARGIGDRGGIGARRLRRDAGDGDRRRLLGAARLPPGQADAPRRRRRLRPDGSRRGAARAWRSSSTPGFRSDEEQAALFAANPDPTWVAPPGQSLHRCGTELDLGPPAAYGWLAANARRFGFLQRYSWEAWHYGYSRGPRPARRPATRSASGGRHRRGDGRELGRGRACPASSPVSSAQPLLRSASRWNVSAALLAAQIMAESNFNPLAVSPAGAQGIAQFMPGTAAGYGLHDPFDAPAAIDAQAHLMSDLLKQFGQIPLALAAYNAGPAPVAACRCVPPYPETKAYVARILGLLDGAGEILAPPLEVRLVASHRVEGHCASRRQACPPTAARLGSRRWRSHR